MILNRQRQVRVAVPPLRQFLAQALARMRLPRGSLTVCLVSDAAMARWNRLYRHKAGPTDVLSFPSGGYAADGTAQRAANNTATHAQQNITKQAPQYVAREAADNAARHDMKSRRARARAQARNPVNGRRPRLFLPAQKPHDLAAPSCYLGDIAISPQSARRNARRFGRTLRVELETLILHGVLHLLGYDHETDAGQMERRERRLRRSLGLR